MLEYAGIATRQRSQLPPGETRHVDPLLLDVGIALDDDRTLHARGRYATVGVNAHAIGLRHHLLEPAGSLAANLLFTDLDGE